MDAHAGLYSLMLLMIVCIGVPVGIAAAIHAAKIVTLNAKRWLICRGDECRAY